MILSKALEAAQVQQVAPANVANSSIEHSLILYLSLLSQVADQGHFDTGFLLPGLLGPRLTRSIRSIFHDPFQGFHRLFAPMSSMNRNFFSSMDSMMGMDMDLDTDVVPNEGACVSEDAPGVTVLQSWRFFLRLCFVLRQMAA